jgi:hypothetical protein
MPCTVRNQRRAFGEARPTAPAQGRPRPGAGPGAIQVLVRTVFSTQCGFTPWLRYPPHTHTQLNGIHALPLAADMQGAVRLSFQRLRHDGAPQPRRQVP